MSQEEPHVVSALVDLCRKIGVSCLVQIGAEDGYEAEQVRLATGCRAVAIDADPQCGPLNGAGIEWHTAFIGATDCAAFPFYLYGTGLSTPFKRDENAKPVEYPQVRLDTFCRDNGIIPDALVIDTEGSTLDVLEGCGELLADVKMCYAEVQAYAIRDGIRPVSDIDALLLPLGFTHHLGLPSYDGGAQSNLTCIRL